MDSQPCFIRYRLYDSFTGQPYKAADADAVSLPSKSVVFQFRDAVKAKNPNKLSSFDASDLLVYKNMHAFERRNSEDNPGNLDPLESLDGLGAHMLIVAVPGGSDGVQGVISDVSSQLYNDLTAPFKDEPSVDELFASLSHHLLKKFPILPSTYERLVKILPNPIMQKIFHSSSVESCDIDGSLMNLAQMRVRVNSRGENAVHFYIDHLISDVLQRLLFSSGLATFADRNVADFSPTTKLKVRPDFLFYVNQFLILRGEEKSSVSGLSDAKKELIQKLKAWSISTFGNLNYIFGFAVGGGRLCFCAMSRNGMLSDISRIYDIESVVDRFEILICVINLARLFRTCQHRIPKDVCLLYQLINRPNGCTIEIQDDCVIKKFPVSIEIFEQQYNYLQILYATLLQHSVPHVIECLKISEELPESQIDSRTIVLKLKPCGIERLPHSLNEFVSAIRCVLQALQAIHRLGYVHRDVRWPNVLCVKDYDWRLIDFENSSQGDQSLRNQDMQMLGTMMTVCRTLMEPSEILVTLSKQLMSERPPDASEALQVLANVSL